jgi:hypothetical protein
MICDNCAFRLFNSYHGIKGIGNEFSNKLVIMPIISRNAAKTNDITNDETYKDVIEAINGNISSTGVDCQSPDLYFTSFIKCSVPITDACNISDDIIDRDRRIIIHEFLTHHFTDIMLLGNVGRWLFGYDCKLKHDTCYITKNNKRYVINYNPLIKHYDKDKFAEFKDNIIKWYNAASNKDYTLYKCVRFYDN